MNTDFQPGQTVFAASVQWLEGTLLGSLAMAIAIIAVACVGLLLLSGRIDVRRGAQVIFGCFILFGASSIAAGMMRIVGDENPPAAVTPAPPPPPPVYVPPAATTPVKAIPYDPYAGAALPTRQ
jgi:type IV secretory pathway VirB2 component (pilin)